MCNPHLMDKPSAGGRFHPGWGSPWKMPSPLRHGLTRVCFCQADSDVFGPEWGHESAPLLREAPLLPSSSTLSNAGKYPGCCSCPPLVPRKQTEYILHPETYCWRFLRSHSSTTYHVTQSGKHNRHSVVGQLVLVAGIFSKRWTVRTACLPGRAASYESGCAGLSGGGEVTGPSRGGPSSST